MGSLDTNVFWIGRRSGDENQLTRLLAALVARDDTALAALCEVLGIEQEVEDWVIELETVHELGRFDLVLRAPPMAVAIIESKIDADLDSTQIRRYLSYLARRHEGHRSLTVVSKKRVPFDESDRVFADGEGIALSDCRWQDLASALQQADGHLAGDFAAMLVAEHLALPPAVSGRDWQVLHEAPRVFARLGALLVCTAEILERDRAFRQTTGATVSGNRRVQVDLARGSLQLRLQFAASDGLRSADTPPVAVVLIRDASTQKGGERGAAETAAGLVSHLGAKAAGPCVRIARPAAPLLAAATLQEQAKAFAELAGQLLDALVAAGASAA